MPMGTRRKPLFYGGRRFRLTPRRTTAYLAALLLGSFVLFLIPAVRYFRVLTGTMALSDATDRITSAVSEIVEEKMREPALDYGYFVTFEKDQNGQIAAIVTDMVRVNILSSELLKAIVHASDQGALNLSIPLGNLLGSGLLLGKGPDVPVEVTMLTSSYVDFRNELVAAGINQTKHQLLLEIVVDVDVLLPWEILSTRVVTEVLVSETVIIGDVPDTYLNMGGTGE